MINTRKENNEVLYSTENFVSLTGDDLSQMKEMAKSNDRNRIRICTHQSVDDDVHEMIIYHPKDSYVPPHMHIEKDESFHLISGEITLILFNEKQPKIAKIKITVTTEIRLIISPFFCSALIVSYKFFISSTLSDI